MAWQDQAELLLRSSLPVGSRILVAVSGGPDSVVLSHFLRGQPYSLIIGHIDHQLRASSAVDAQFVQALARKWDIPCGVTRVPVQRYSHVHSMGIEEAARILRYQALAIQARKNRCMAIVAAHTANDQAETVLMNFLRGSGPAGLAGIPVVRHLRLTKGVPIVRPFLKVTRKEILAYLSTYKLKSRQDPSNRSLRFHRNRIRHEVLPYLEKRSPGIAQRLIQTADIFQEEEDYWQDHLRGMVRKSVQKNVRGFTVVLDQLLRYHKALSRRILRQILPGLTFQEIEQVLQWARSPQGTRWFQFSGGWRIRCRNNQLVVAHKKEDQDE